MVINTVTLLSTSIYTIDNVENYIKLIDQADIKGSTHFTFERVDNNSFAVDALLKIISVKDNEIIYTSKLTPIPVCNSAKRNIVVSSSKSKTTTTGSRTTINDQTQENTEETEEVDEEPKKKKKPTKGHKKESVDTTNEDMLTSTLRDACILNLGNEDDVKNFLKNKRRVVYNKADAKTPCNQIYVAVNSYKYKQKRSGKVRFKLGLKVVLNPADKAYRCSYHAGLTEKSTGELSQLFAEQFIGYSEKIKKKQAKNNAYLAKPRKGKKYNFKVKRVLYPQTRQGIKAGQGSSLNHFISLSFCD
jgi:hypothetical protein